MFSNLGSPLNTAPVVLRVDSTEQGRALVDSDVPREKGDVVDGYRPHHLDHEPSQGWGGLRKVSSRKNEVQRLARRRGRDGRGRVVHSISGGGSGVGFPSLVGVVIVHA